jgi:hypothetical protein
MSISRGRSFCSLKLGSKLVLECLVDFFVVPVLSPELFVAGVSASHFDITVKVWFELFKVVVLLEKLVYLLLLLLIIEDGLGHFSFGILVISGSCSE